MYMHYIKKGYPPPPPALTTTPPPRIRQCNNMTSDQITTQNSWKQKLTDGCYQRHAVEHSRGKVPHSKWCSIGLQPDSFATCRHNFLHEDVKIRVVDAGILQDEVIRYLFESFLVVVFHGPLEGNEYTGADTQVGDVRDRQQQKSEVTILRQSRHVSVCNPAT